MKSACRVALIAALPGLLAVGSSAHAEQPAGPYRKAIEKGLEWLASQQQRDGHWEASGNRYPVSMTALSGMALLMEGSTLREGRYSERVRRGVDWLMTRTQRNGLIGDANRASEAQRYMYGHGFGLLFLASVYGEEEDADRRKTLEDILVRAVQYSGKAQTSRGGWGYLANGCYREGDDQDEGSVTITQLQALRAARNAGITVPSVIIEKAIDYLQKSTTTRGGVIYSLSMGRRDERPALTAAAIACGFSAGEYKGDQVKRWLNYCQGTIPALDSTNSRRGHDEYTHYYWAQVLYILGEDGFARLFPDAKDDERLAWSKYRKTTFDSLVQMQSADGSWQSSSNWGAIGPIYATSMYLTILQLDNGVLPIYQR